MWRSPVIVTAPATEPLTLAMAKAHVRVDDDADDALIGALIATARAHVEARTGTRLVTQTVSIRADGWTDLASLPIGPVGDVVSVGYLDADDEAATLSADDYDLQADGLEARIALAYGARWPAIRDGSLITVTCEVGYGDADEQPPEVVQAMLLLIGDFYAQRESFVTGTIATAVPLAATVDALLANHTKFLI